RTARPSARPGVRGHRVHGARRRTIPRRRSILEVKCGPLTAGFQALALRGARPAATLGRCEGGPSPPEPSLGAPDPRCGGRRLLGPDAAPFRAPPSDPDRPPPLGRGG